MTITTIMKRRDICKPDPTESLRSEISSRYQKEAVRFQHLHNSSHPEDRIWRHMLYIRTFHFLSGGVLLTVKVEMVRFIYVNSNRTFTFYSSLALRSFLHKTITAPLAPPFQGWYNHPKGFYAGKEAPFGCIKQKQSTHP